MDFAISLFVFFVLIAYVLCSKVKDSYGYFNVKADEAEQKRVNLLINGDAKFDPIDKLIKTEKANGWCSDYDGRIIMAKEGFAFPVYSILNDSNIGGALDEHMQKVLEALRKAHPELIINFDKRQSAIGYYEYHTRAERRVPKSGQRK